MMIARQMAAGALAPLALSLALVLGGGHMSPAAAQDDIREVQVAFPAGSTGTEIRDEIAGYASVSYLVGAEGGQTMRVTLNASTNQTYFTVFGPGQAPGGEGLAGSDMIGPMVPDINRFEAVLETSGVYNVHVYQMRNAARQGLKSDFTLAITVTGETGAVVKGDYADGLEGGPDFWEVRTSSGGGSLNMRAQPSTGDAVVTAVANGTVLRNLGCRMAEGRRWCHVATLADPGYEGWVAGEFLFESAYVADQGVATQLPASAPQGNMDRPVGGVMPDGSAFNATGLIACTRSRDAADAMCEFGVIRQGNGNGAVTVFWPDDGTRVIYFENGAPAYFDRSEADAGAEMTVTRDSDNNIVFIGEERFVIPDAVIYGG